MAVELVGRQGHVHVDVPAQAGHRWCCAGLWRVLRDALLLGPLLVTSAKEAFRPFSPPPLGALLGADRLLEGGMGCSHGAQAQLWVNGSVLIVNIGVVMLGSASK